MALPIGNIRLSQQAREQLIRLKRYTGIKNWNVLCRWGLVLSLAEPSTPMVTRIPSDSSVEMTWKVFGGEYQELYLALVRLRCHEDGLGTDDETVASQFRLHLHRGIAHLAGLREVRSIEGLLSMLPPPQTQEFSM